MRTDKLNAEFKRYIAEILTKKVKDPRITEMFTVVQVDCDNDISYAKVYVSIFSTNPERSALTFTAIKENAHVVRREISRNMHIRKVPEFIFQLDTSMEYGAKIGNILNEINKKSNN